MKKPLPPPFSHSRLSGSVLLGTMIFVLAIAAFLASYLWVVQNSNQAVSRAQQWNSALAIAEAGVEEGMANINQVGITDNANATGFSLLSNGLNGGRYYAIGSAAGVVCTITSTGVVSAPITGDFIRRTVQVTAQREALFSKGMISMTFIDLNGNGLIVDSYNSHNPNQSLNGLWTGYSGTNGDVAAVDGLVDIGNHTIDGNLYLGPNSSYSLGPNGQITGTVYNDWNMQFGDANLPQVDSGGMTLATPWPNAPGTTSSHTFTNSGYYTIRDNGTITVNPGVKVILDVKQTSYTPTMTIMGGTTNSGTLVMYQESGSVTLGGSGSAGATDGRPENFAYFGLSGVTSITYGGNATFVGTIYAPEADFTQSGGGKNNIDFIGSLVVKSITVNGHFGLHYDTSLIGLYYGYFVAGSWQEL